MKTIKQIRKALLLITLAIQSLILSINPANADVMTGVNTPCVPEARKLKTHGSLTIDHSHASDGYIIVNTKIYYTLNNDGEEEILPLQYGDGRYTVTLFRHTSGINYRKDGEISFRVKMVDKRGYMLYPNQWVNYTNETAAVVYANELCAGMTDEYEIIMTVYNFIDTYFGYDWFKYRDVKSGVLKEILPNIDGAWESRSGICQDLAAVMCTMLRSQGIHANLVVGTCGSTPHAWVTVYYYGADGKLKSLSLDPTKCCKVTAESGYKEERYY